MRWEIKGADATTGADRIMTVEAADQKEAEDRARYNGILVESVRRSDAPSNGNGGAQLQYATPLPKKSWWAGAFDWYIKSSHLPEHRILPEKKRLESRRGRREIAAMARRIENGAGLLAMLAVLSFAAGVVCIIVGATTLGGGSGEGILIMLSAVPCVLTCIFFWAFSAALSMLAEIGRAVHDLRFRDQ